MWQRRSFRELLNLIDHLPGHSHFAAAVANDDDHAEMLLAAEDSQPKGSYHPSLTSWTPEVAQLVNLTDLLKNLIAVTISAANGKAPKVAPSPRPETAIDRIRRERSQKVFSDLKAILTPGR